MTRGSFVRQDAEEQELLSVEESAPRAEQSDQQHLGAEDERHRIQKEAKQSKCPAPKELLKQRFEYKLCSNDDGVMEWHGGVVKGKYKTTPGWYHCALDDGTAVVLLFENSNRDSVWRIAKMAAMTIAFAIAPSSPRASPSAAAKPLSVTLSLTQLALLPPPLSWYDSDDEDVEVSYEIV
jgi:hypothetical protein